MSAIFSENHTTVVHRSGLSLSSPSMKHLNSRSSDSLLSTISSSSPTDDMCLTEDRYEIQAMLDSLDDSLNGEDHNEMESHPTKGKKRRLNLTQVKALEKHFQADNKLEPQRKMKLAMELGLQPRQVAVWFQNRRARWKNKQLEKEYEVLKSSYEELKRRYENVGREKELLKAELGDLKLKLGDASESESDNPNNTANVDEPVVDYGQHQIWSCSSSSLMQLDCSASYLPENLSWFESGIGEAGADGGPACPSWFNFEVDY